METVMGHREALHEVRRTTVDRMHLGNLEQVGSKQDILKRPATDFVRSLFAKPAAQLGALNAAQNNS